MKDTWSYCPTCGTQINKKITMLGILKKQMDVMRNLTGRIDEYEPRIQQPRNAITIQINGNGIREPRIHVFPQPKQSIESQPHVDKKLSRKMPKNVVEPEVKVKRLGREIIFDIPLPNVNSEEDVELNILSDSVEVKAFAKKKGYFKILNVPENHKLIDKSLNEGNLNLKFAV